MIVAHRLTAPSRLRAVVFAAFVVLSCFFLSLVVQDSGRTFAQPAGTEKASTESDDHKVIIPPQLDRTSIKGLVDIFPATRVLLSEYRKAFVSLRFASEASYAKGSVEDFLQTGGGVMKEWSARRRALFREYTWLGQREAELLRVRREQAGSDPDALNRILADDDARARIRAQLHRELQMMVDEHALRLGKQFRYLFHMKLDAAVAEIDPSKGALEARRDAVVQSSGVLFRDEDPELAGDNLSGRLRGYTIYWTRWSFDNRIRALGDPKKEATREPVREEPKKEVGTREPVKEEPKREPAKEEPKKEVVKREVPREQPKKEVAREPKKESREEPKSRDPRICPHSDDTLPQYQKYLEGLSRTCSSTNLPDRLVRSCLDSFITKELSGCEHRQMFNFILFSTENYYARLDSLDYFSESDGYFRPFVELAQKYLEDRGFAVDYQERARIREIMEKVKAAKPR